MARPNPERLVSGLATLAWLAASTVSCTTDVVQPDCHGPVELVAQGRIGGESAERVSSAIDGRWMHEKFYVDFADPQGGKGRWVLEFGYNPLIDELNFLGGPKELANDLSESGRTTFQVLTRRPTGVGTPAEQSCDPLSGQLCGGVGIYFSAAAFDPAKGDVAGEREYDAYLPVSSGSLTFESLDSLQLQGRYELTLGHDAEDRYPGSGELSGCFAARRRTESGQTGERLE